MCGDGFEPIGDIVERLVSGLRGRGATPGVKGATGEPVPALGYAARHSDLAAEENEAADAFRDASAATTERGAGLHREVRAKSGNGTRRMELVAGRTEGGGDWSLPATAVPGQSCEVRSLRPWRGAQEVIDAAGSNIGEDATAPGRDRGYAVASVPAPRRGEELRQVVIQLP